MGEDVLYHVVCKYLLLHQSQFDAVTPRNCNLFVLISSNSDVEESLMRTNLLICEDYFF